MLVCLCLLTTAENVLRMTKQILKKNFSLCRFYAGDTINSRNQVVFLLEGCQLLHVVEVVVARRTLLLLNIASLPV